MNKFKKHVNNPLFGSKEIGTMFDAYVWEQNKMLRMDVSYRKKKSCAVTFSKDGINWSEPKITLPPRLESGWEDDINRNCVLFIDGKFKMWYTGQARGFSYIGYAESTDGIHFQRLADEPILVPEYPYEGFSVMNPCVLYENGVYKMWYSAGETYEPNVIAYAESTDGIHFKKHKANPIFVCDKKEYYEKDRIGGCCVIRTNDMGYIMFYIGYEDINTARICVAQSNNGITGWKKSPLNPLISPDKGAWDEDACYKPAAYWDDAENKWKVWYNGRRGEEEYIGLATFNKRNLFEDDNK